MAVQADLISSGLWLKSEVTYYEPKIIERVYPALWGFEGLYHNASADLPLGVQEIVQGRIDHTGKAVNYGGRAMDIPLVNVGIGVDNYKVLLGVLGAEWGLFDLMAQMEVNSKKLLPQRNLVNDLMTAMDVGLREWIHIRTLFGDPAIGFQGYFNNNYVEVINVTDNVYAYTPQQLYNFILSIVYDFQDKSRLTAEATSILVPVPFKRALLNRFGDNTTDANPLHLLLDDGRGSTLQEINVVNELRSQYLEQYAIQPPGTNKDMIIVYENTSDPEAGDTLKKYFHPIDRTEPFLLDDGLTHRITSFAAISEMMVNQSFKVKYYKIPAAPPLSNLFP